MRNQGALLLNLRSNAKNSRPALRQDQVVPSIMRWINSIWQYQGALLLNLRSNFKNIRPAFRQDQVIPGTYNVRHQLRRRRRLRQIAKTMAQNRRQLKATESNGEQRKRRSHGDERPRAAESGVG
jgi:hypothetical protein